MERFRGYAGLILGIDTSCDDTCAAVLHDNEILSSIISSQTEFHALYGGVVPEIASRHHLELVNAVIARAITKAGVELNRITRIAVTTKPGLIGALLVGVATAKSMAYALGVELVGVNHMEGHVAANYLPPAPIEPPFICLVASGGHTSIVFVPKRDEHKLLGQTLDDAAGEALDKGARLLGLGYPGGAELDDLAADGVNDYVTFPVGLDKPGRLDFSFSGVKTALYYYLRDLEPELFHEHRADIAASYQSAVITALIKKTLTAAASEGCNQICIGGGVSANSELRRRLAKECERQGMYLHIPVPALCTDNAAMIASAGRYLPALSLPDCLSMGASASAGFAA